MERDTIIGFEVNALWNDVFRHLESYFAEHELDVSNARQVATATAEAYRRALEAHLCVAPTPPPEPVEDQESAP